MAKYDKNFGKRYEKVLFEELLMIPDIWAYRFPAFDRTQWVSQPGDLLILSKWYNILVEVKTTIHQTISRRVVKPKQIKHLLQFDVIKQNKAFVLIFFVKAKRTFLIPIYNYVTLPLTIRIDDCVSVGVEQDLVDFVRLCNDNNS